MAKAQKKSKTKSPPAKKTAAKAVKAKVKVSKEAPKKKTAKKAAPAVKAKVTAKPPAKSSSVAPKSKAPPAKAAGKSVPPKAAAKSVPASKAPPPKPASKAPPSKVSPSKIPPAAAKPAAKATSVPPPAKAVTAASQSKATLKTPTENSKPSTKEDKKKPAPLQAASMKVPERLPPRSFEDVSAPRYARVTDRPPRPETTVPKVKDPVQGLKAHPDSGLNEDEVQFLYQRLVGEKAKRLGELEKHVSDALADDDVLADEIDIAQRSTDQAWLFRVADKERKLLIEIDSALERLRTGDYGLCEGTDEPIGFKRLELNPWARYTVAYKEMREREKAQQVR